MPEAISIGYEPTALETVADVLKLGEADQTGMVSPFFRPLYIAPKEELEALYDMELTGLEEKVRDVFLIGCYTAQRFSDYSRI